MARHIKGPALLQQPLLPRPFFFCPVTVIAVKKNAILIGLGLLIALLFVGNAARFYRIGLVDRLTENLYDYSLQLTMPRTVDERIVILDIDEKSLMEEGRWPWSRNRMAMLMDKLFDNYAVAVVGFDVVFAEKDESSGLAVLQGLAQDQLKEVRQFRNILTQIQPQLEYDKLFASKIMGRKVVLGYYLTNQKNKLASGVLPEPTFPAGTFKGRSTGFTAWNGYGANLTELQQAAAGAGHFNPKVDIDGMVRRVPMLVEYNGAYYEALSLAMVRTLLGQTELLPGFVESRAGGYSGLEWLELRSSSGSLKIPVDGEVATYVPYRGRQGSFVYISIADVMHDRVDPSQLKGKIVLVGTTAPGLMDLRSTPVSEVYPGVEVHANMISGILDQNLKERPVYMLGAEVVWLLLIGVVMSLLLPQLSPPRAVLVSIFMFTGTAGLSLVSWQYWNTMMPVANSWVMIALIFCLNMSYAYFFTSRTKSQIARLFGQHVPAEVVEEMAKHPENASVEGESREMTILFSGVSGFTSISQGLSPKELTSLMDEFLTPLSHVVYKHRGTIDKYMGDRIMAFWGAPMPDSAHARKAILAGIEMQSALKALQPRFRECHWPEIRIGIGVNTGKVCVGNMGSDVRAAYTVLGDEVDLASRLEEITSQYGVGIIVGENTRNAVPDIVYRELDHVAVKGKDKPVAIYEPVGLHDEVSNSLHDEIKRFHEVRRLYRKQDWDKAELQLMNLQRMSPDTMLYRIYAERIAHFRKHPPPAAWDGVCELQTK